MGGGPHWRADGFDFVARDQLVEGSEARIRGDDDTHEGYGGASVRCGGKHCSGYEDVSLGPRLQFTNTGDARAEAVRARVESFRGHDVAQEREALSEWADLGAILSGADVPSAGAGAEGERKPRFVSFPITQLTGEWGALEHHDEWLVSIEYTSVGGTRLRTLWTYNGEVLAHEVVRERPSKRSGR